MQRAAERRKLEAEASEQRTSATRFPWKSAGAAQKRELAERKDGISAAIAELEEEWMELADLVDEE